MTCVGSNDGLSCSDFDEDGAGGGGSCDDLNGAGGGGETQGGRNGGITSHGVLDHIW